MKTHAAIGSESSVYREFQFSWLLTGILIPVQLLIIFFYVTGLGNRPLPTNGFLMLSGLFVFLYLILYGMTTVLDKTEITLSFGIGLIRKRIKLEAVKSVEAVKNPWYYGYGIRMVPNGWLFNVSGPHAVELRFHDRKGVVMIGTKDPLKLKNAVSILLVGSRA